MSQLLHVIEETAADADRADGGGAETETAIREDRRLTEKQKKSLLDVYRGYIAGAAALYGTATAGAPRAQAVDQRLLLGM